MVICGVATALVVYVGPGDMSPAASAAKRLSALPDPTGQPVMPSPLVPEPVTIPQAIPTTLAVHAANQELIAPATVDQQLLGKGADGRVKPGDQPGLYVADGVSTLPGSEQGTVIIGGHAKASQEMVFNPLMKLGSDDLNHSYVMLELPGGRLVYTIEAIYIVDKVDLPQQHELSDNRPGRVLLITCDVENGDNTFQNLIVVACDESHTGCGAM